MRDQRDPTEPPFQRILLVGFMGSGKSTVGPLLAHGLGWEYVDLDAEIERRAGRSIPDLFREEGEEAFRALEDRTAREWLGRDRIVLAPGGGWPCREGRMEGVGPGTRSIWLQVSPEVAVARSLGQGIERPLLAVEDPAARARELLSQRERYYRKARWQVDTDERSAEEVARVVRDLLGTEPGRPPRA